MRVSCTALTYILVVQPVDVYAYGVLLNEMVMMERPYEGNSPEWVMSAGSYIEILEASCHSQILTMDFAFSPTSFELRCAPANRRFVADPVAAY